MTTTRFLILPTPMGNLTVEVDKQEKIAEFYDKYGFLLGTYKLRDPHAKDLFVELHEIVNEKGLWIIAALEKY